MTDAVSCWAYPKAGKPKCNLICDIFIEGCNGRVAPGDHPTLEPGPAFFYGWWPNTAPKIRQCVREKRDWYYADNAYWFGRGTYFRITRNAMMHDGRGNAGPKRFENTGLSILPWRKTGRYILITTQSEMHYTNRLNTTRKRWTRDVIKKIRRSTDREIRVCDKPPPKSMKASQAHSREFEPALNNAWAVVTHSSSSAVKALMDGVPVFSLGQSMASIMGLDDLSKIETPIYPDGRLQWLWNLAANQWTLNEVREGICWRTLQDAKAAS